MGCVNGLPSERQNPRELQLELLRDALKKAQDERDELREVLAPFALHAKALGLPKRQDNMTVVSQKGVSAICIGAFRSALEMFPELMKKAE